MIFSEEIKTGFPDLKADLIQIESSINEHNIRSIQAITQLEKSKPFSKNVLLLMQLCLYRSRMLIEGCIHSVNAHNPLVAYLSIRAHFEVTGLLAYYLKKQKDYYSLKISPDELYLTIDKLLFSGKIKELKELNAPDPVNVMKYIELADSLTNKYLGDKSPFFREVYDLLSEYCHPNFMGIYMYQEEQTVNVTLMETRMTEKSIGKVLHLNVSILSFLLFYDEVINDLFNNSEIPLEYHPVLMEKANFV